MILLHTSDSSGTCFIRTDQLDGETDWKLRVAVPECQKLDEGDLIRLDAEIYGNWFTFLDGQILNVLQLTRQSRTSIRLLVPSR